MANTVVRFLKDIGAEFGTKGDVYVNDAEQMARLDAYIAKRKLGKAYEVLKGDVEKAAGKAANKTEA